MPTTKICKQCGNEFTIIRRTREYIKKAKFCSQSCYRLSPDSLKGRYKNGHVGLKGTKNPMWKTGKTLRKDGYVKTCDDILEHRKVMENYLGRKLHSSEIVHHIDGNRSNNDISNLMVFPNSSAHIHFHWHYTDSFKERSHSYIFPK